MNEEKALPCPGCVIDNNNNVQEWGVRGHFAKFGNESYHILRLIVNCIKATRDNAEIHVATCIWKDDKTDDSFFDGEDVLDALQEAADRGCKINLIKPKGDQIKESEYNSPTMNKKLDEFASNNKNVIYTYPKHWNHFKGVMISSLTLTNTVSKYFGVANTNEVDVFLVTIITSANLSEMDARKYQDLTLSWNWEDNKNDTHAGFIYHKTVGYFNELISKFIKYDTVLTSKGARGVGVLYYPRVLRDNDKNDDKTYAKSDPIVQFFNKFKKINSIKVAMAYWQGVRPYEGRYTFRRVGVTDHLIERVKNESTEVSIIINQIALPEDATNRLFWNENDPVPQLAHYKENALAIPEFFRLRDTMLENDNQLSKDDVSIRIVNNNSQQWTPYIHSKYMIVEGEPNETMESDLQGSTEFLWAGSSNIDNYGAWDNAEITIILGNETPQGLATIEHYKDNYHALFSMGRVFKEETKIFGGTNIKTHAIEDITYEYYKEDGSRDRNNHKQYP
ncbi:Uncharacterised protein [Serratia proteamaculans]|uniref:phospholipase D-like domain-containing protein n=1 Tax=Serratia proteamaculans TaxID=28151 RepID=UPI001249D75E|nr:hypothetical protein [Serratia proteamaculans]KAB1498337.1 hypothetical protein F8R23_02445 [Serratia proteamaculans]CAI0743561.1 Uncharacterised protein [Serratia proteamaculans]CAI0826192.1 Uncharacterised protein [Serratia proteamaculans]